MPAIHDPRRGRVLGREQQVAADQRLDAGAGRRRREDDRAQRVEELGHAARVERGDEPVEAAEVVVEAARARPARGEHGRDAEPRGVALVLRERRVQQPCRRALPAELAGHPVPGTPVSAAAWRHSRAASSGSAAWPPVTGFSVRTSR